MDTYTWGSHTHTWARMCKLTYTHAQRTHTHAQAHTHAHMGSHTHAVAQLWELLSQTQARPAQAPKLVATWVAQSPGSQPAERRRGRPAARGALDVRAWAAPGSFGARVPGSWFYPTSGWGPKSCCPLASERVGMTQGTWSWWLLLGLLGSELGAASRDSEAPPLRSCLWKGPRSQ